MKFKKYYEDTAVFESVFDRYYSKGYFGSIDRELIKESEKSWFDRIHTFINTKNLTELEHILLNYENKIAREYFTEITKVDIKNKRREVILNTLKECFK